jgi:Na+-driven multidrug efflux pump
MISQITGAVINLILDPIMIFGLLGFPRMGVTGAAAATVIGQIAAACLAVHLNLKKNREIDFSAKGFRPDLAAVKRIYSVGLPTIMMGGLGSVMIYGLNGILISFTATAAAVFGAYFKLQSFVFMPIFGLNSGMVPILAYNFGARRQDRITQTIRLSMMYAAGIMAIGTAIFQLYPRELLALFNASDDMTAIGVPALRIISGHYMCAAFCIVSLSVFQAFGSGMYSLTVAVCRQLLLLLPIAWLLSLTGELSAIWWAFPITEAVTLALCAFLMRRVHREKISAV